MTRRPYGFFILMVLVACGGAIMSPLGYGLLGGVMIGFALVGALWAAGDGLWEQYNNGIEQATNRIRARTAFALSVAQTDSETRHFLAHEWPELGVEFGDDHLVYLLENGVNTQVLLQFLQAFLRDSTSNHFVEMRSYNDDKHLEERFNVSREVVRKQWTLATRLLEGRGYLKEGSMAGQSTWKWSTPETYGLLCRRYLNVRELTHG